MMTCECNDERQLTTADMNATKCYFSAAKAVSALSHEHTFYIVHSRQARFGPSRMWQPQNVELVLHALSLARLGLALFRPELGEREGHPRYTFRACGQAGLAQGLLALPSLSTAVYIATRSWWWQQLSVLLLASSFQALLWLAWTAAIGPRRGAATAAAASTPAAAAICNGNCNDGSSSGCSATGTPGDGQSSGSAEHRPSWRNSLLALLPVKPILLPADAYLSSKAWTNTSSRRKPSAASAATREAMAVAAATNTVAPALDLFATHFLLAFAALSCITSALGSLRLASQPPPATSPQLLLPGSVFELPRDITTSVWILTVTLLLGTVPSLDRLASA
ncbi:hypothetical protein Agub_g4512, partial [Astrephomene gubernaculifera]